MIAGAARGRTLLAPKGMSTRPMMDIVKGSLFNMLDALGGVEGIVLDLFAGSGSLGIEALSRGAEHADFVEQNRAACQVITENLTRLGFASQGHVVIQSVEAFIKTPTLPAHPALHPAGQAVSPGRNDNYDLVFMDAPYANRVSQHLLALLAAGSLLADDAFVCVGHHQHEDLPERIGNLAQIKHRRFGASCISIFQNLKSETPSSDPPRALGGGGRTV